MFQPSQSSSIKRFKKPLNVRLVELDKLKQHEEVDQTHLEELKKEIKSDGILKIAIAVDMNTNIVLDGEHRLNALKKLGCKKVPVVFVDYHSAELRVCAWRKGEELTKKNVIEAGFSEKKLPPTTTKHMVKISDRLIHISAIEKRVDIPLEKLGADIR